MSIRVIGPLGVRYPVGLQAKGDEVESHAHDFDHVTFCLHGAYRVEADVNGEPVAAEIRAAKPGAAAQNYVLIKAGVKHKLIALEDDSLYQCWYAHRNTRGEAVENYTGWPKAYG